MAFFGESFDDPRTQGILQAAAAMLGSRGQNFGQSLGAGMQAGLSGYGDAQKVQAAMLMKKAEEEQRKRLQESQIAENEAQMAQRAKISSLLDQAFGGQVAGQAVPQALPQALPQGQPDSEVAQSIPMGGGMPQQPQQQQQSGKYPLSLNQISALKAAGGPDLLEMLKYANAGDKKESGSYYTNPITNETVYMPKVGEGMAMGRGGNAMAIPGFANAQAEIAGSTAGAKSAAESGYKLKERFDPISGQMVTDTEANIINRARGGEPAIAKQSAGSEVFKTKLAEDAAKNYDVIQKQGTISASNAANAAKIAQLLGASGGSPIGETWQAVAKYAKNMGITIDKNVAGVEGATALASKLASAMRPVGSGAQSDVEFKSYQAQVPSLLTTQGGRAIIAENFQKQAQRDVDIARMHRDWLKAYGSPLNPDSKGRILDDYINLYSQKKPLTLRTE